MAKTSIHSMDDVSFGLRVKLAVRVTRQELLLQVAPFGTVESARTACVMDARHKTRFRNTLTTNSVLERFILAPTPIRRYLANLFAQAMVRNPSVPVGSMLIVVSTFTLATALPSIVRLPTVVL